MLVCFLFTSLSCVRWSIADRLSVHITPRPHSKRHHLVLQQDTAEQGHLWLHLACVGIIQIKTPQPTEYLVTGYCFWADYSVLALWIFYQTRGYCLLRSEKRLLQTILTMNVSEKYLNYDGVTPKKFFKVIVKEICIVFWIENLALKFSLQMSRCMSKLGPLQASH